MEDDINCVFEGLNGIGSIYISNIKTAQNLQVLQNHSIKAVITVLSENTFILKKEQVTDYLYVMADDAEDQDIMQYFEQTYAFIEDMRKKTNVLVHCYAGISRSATIVIAYLIRKYACPLETVLTIVKRKRNKINPNSGFLEQLKKESFKFGHDSAKASFSFFEVAPKSSEKLSKPRLLSRGKKIEIDKYSLLLKNKSFYKKEEKKACSFIQQQIMSSNIKPEIYEMNYLRSSAGVQTTHEMSEEKSNLYLSDNRWNTSSVSNKTLQIEKLRTKILESVQKQPKERRAFSESSKGLSVYHEPKTLAVAELETHNIQTEPPACEKDKNDKTTKNRTDKKEEHVHKILFEKRAFFL